MQTGEHAKIAPPSESQAGTPVPKIPDTEKNPITPERIAKLPAHSQATAAQRLSETSLAPMQGIDYPISHNRISEPGQHMKVHVKRKKLREMNRRCAKAERISTKTMLPLAGMIALVCLAGVLVFITVAGFVDATHRKYGNAAVTLEDLLPRDNFKEYDTHGNLIYQAIDQGIQTSEPLNKISPNLAHAEIAIEDQSFYKNPGYDITGIVRAALDDLTNNHVVSGGSTITQQLIKNAIVGNKETVIRKLQEVTLAPEVTRYYTKDQILQMYLNTAYYGQQAYGAEAAAYAYYGLTDKPHQTAAQQLDLAQASMLAGIPSSPTARNPLLFRQSALQRQQEVLQQMYEQGYITAKQKAQAIIETEQPHFFKPGIIHNVDAPHFASYAEREVANDFHVRVSDLSRSGLVAYTTLDLALNNKVQVIAKKHIEEMAASHNMSNAAVVVIDYHTGAVKALVGNIDPNNPQYGNFDVATQGLRQPGSSFKPFIYATAFEDGISPGQIILDEPLTVQMCCGLPSYSPHNYDEKFHGAVTLRYALQNSFNIPAVKLLMQVGVDKALKTAQNMGITTYTGVPNYTMVLGSLSISLLDNTSAYGTFANGGIHVPPHAIQKVTDPFGHVLFQPSTQGTRALSKATAFIMTSVLSDNNSRIFEFGKCSSLLIYPHTMNECYAGNPGPIRPSAAKTGTSNDFRDNWTMGYTSDFVVGVWAGNNDNTPMSDITGVDGAGPIWHDTMLAAEQGHPIKQFGGPPPGVVMETKDYNGTQTKDWHIVGH